MSFCFFHFDLIEFSILRIASYICYGLSSKYSLACGCILYSICQMALWLWQSFIRVTQWHCGVFCMRSPRRWLEILGWIFFPIQFLMSQTIEIYIRYFIIEYYTSDGRFMATHFAKILIAILRSFSSHAVIWIWKPIQLEIKVDCDSRWEAKIV